MKAFLLDASGHLRDHVDADALRKLCRSLRWEIVSDTTSSEDEFSSSLVPAESDPAETDPAVSPAETDAD